MDFDTLIYWVRSVDSHLEKLVYAEQAIARALSDVRFDGYGNPIYKEEDEETIDEPAPGVIVDY